MVKVTTMDRQQRLQVALQVLGSIESDGDNSRDHACGVLLSSHTRSIFCPIRKRHLMLWQ